MKLKNVYILASLLLSAGTTLAAAPHAVTETSPNIVEDFNSAEGKQLPAGWAIDVNRDKTRTIRSWTDAQTFTDNDNAGPSLASNQKNGSYFFYSSSDNNDLALGGITTGTGTANGADCITVMTALTNEGASGIDRVDVSYSIEKYRYGNNASGWEVSLWYSLDGVKWVAAGDNFKNVYAADGSTGGAEVVPVKTDRVENQVLMVDVAPGETLYLGWMMTVASGDQGSGAQVFGLDDVTLTVSYADSDARYIYVENATGLASLSLFAPSFPDYYGSAPGEISTLTKNVNGVSYSVWPVKGNEEYTVTVMASGREVGSKAVHVDSDTYLCASPEGLTEIENPGEYTGWVDPNRPPFSASGIYLRGEVNSWGSPADWEFSKEDETTYALYDKTLKGQFKVADASWSAACNYGSNGSNIMAGEPYSLVGGTDTNISCGNYTFACSRIVLTIYNGTATLTLVGDDSETGLTTIYMAGDFNDWNYTGAGGELKLDTNDNLFKGRVSMKAGDTGNSEWLLYLRPGKIGVYGSESDAVNPSLRGTLVKGSENKIATPPGTYDVTVDLSGAKYTLTEVASEPSLLTLDPEYTVLVKNIPSTVKVLSLNNSLIHYNDQARMFNEIALAMGKDATWTKHTNLGKTLQYHWEEGEGLTPDGMPGARMMVRSDAWSHIILQEQTALPRTDLSTFKKSVKQWVDYIRDNCPNPNAVIILPMNWHYAQDWSNFNENNHILMANYGEVARELGVVVCPVAVAYQAKFDKDGGAATESEWFLPGDDRHPTIRATYMAALMEYGLIFNEDPNTVTVFPEYTTEYDSKKINAAVAEEMRGYASDALKDYVNTIDHHSGSINFSSSLYDDFGIELKPEAPVSFSVEGEGASINDNGVFSASANGIYTVTASTGEFSKTATVVVADPVTEVPVYPSVNISVESPEVTENFDLMGEEAEASLPEGWRIDRQTSAPRTLGSFASAVENTMYAGGVNLPSNAKNGLWNFGADGSDDRAVGGITTGVADGTRAVNVYLHLHNEGTKPFASLDISYDIEKYRKGSNAAGFTVQLYHSLDGKNWTSAGELFRIQFEKDSATEGYAQVPGEVRTVEASLPVDFGGGMDLYLAWNISVTSGTDASSAMALAIDNVTVTGVRPAVTEYKYHIYVDDRTSYDALGLYAYGSGEIFGAWPGQAPIDEKDIEGTVYKVFGHDEETGNFNFIFNNWNQGKQLPDYPVTGGKDYYLMVSDSGVKEIDLSGVNVTVTEDEEPEYYNLNGIKIDRPEKGIYIVRRGGKVSKVVK